MKSFKCEYIWLSVREAGARLNSKTRVLSALQVPTAATLPCWTFDDPTTGHAVGLPSGCVLRPVRVWPDASRIHGYLVLCDVLYADGMPHESNVRATYEDDLNFWFGFEQTYVLTQDGVPLGDGPRAYSKGEEAGYGSVGARHLVAQAFVEDHLELCLACGLAVTGLHAGTTLGQWSFQLMGQGAKSAADDLWLARYLLLRVAERYQVQIALRPNIMLGEVVRTGMPTHFSSARMRSVGGEKYFKMILDELQKHHKDHMNSYGLEPKDCCPVLEGAQAIEAFSYGVGDRHAAIGIPLATLENGWKGYLEDRRPATNACPYMVTSKIMQAVSADVLVL